MAEREWGVDSCEQPLLHMWSQNQFVAIMEYWRLTELDPINPN
jgi:hypothetical protein